MNHLASSTSPYLLQHADNPVDWWPWCEEAFAEAARRDVPVLLSVGYAACHWCHVMAHESFEDRATAALLNERMVAIKVDREERPDVDSVYMTATQVMTGQGGWPMTVVMTPGKEPFFCGTYLPRENFQQLILATSKAWRERRRDLTAHAAQITDALTRNAEAVAEAMRAGAGQSPWVATADRAAVSLEDGYDLVSAGFGGAPKFPPSMVIEFLLRYYERTGHPAAQAMATGTLEAMARGGMYDQIGGGFARYSVDATWTVPHFEKMLYDNALLARAYAHHWRLTGSELSRRVARETCEWMIRELRTASGGFASSLDADSPDPGGTSREGAFYVWRPDELDVVLGRDDGAFAADFFGVTQDGTFEGGASVLQLRVDPVSEADASRLARIRTELWLAREERARPGRDDKVVAAWNGMAIAALAEAGLLLSDPSLIAAAVDAASLLASVHLADGRMIRTSRDGKAGNTGGALDDYACVAEGFLVLAGVTGSARWVELAGSLLDVALSLFTDGSGGFYDSAADGEALIFRPADPSDDATPSGAFAMAGALVSYSALTGSAAHRKAAKDALAVLPAIVARFPRAAGAGLAAAEAVMAGPAEIAIIGPAGDPRTAALHRTALEFSPPGAVLALGDGVTGGIPLLEGRGLVDGAPAAYVCRDFTCLVPVTTPDDLRAQLTKPA
ncbi:MAG TPA: thioredoxin domain-containing protein [Streptosporangiaceae bacterium]|nr:thioredoxin domain-containing protein [Streptosporangiaceae bacterium]